MVGAADVAETTKTPFQAESLTLFTGTDSSSGRVKPAPGSLLALFATYSYHGFITDRDWETLELEADHRSSRRDLGMPIRDLKYERGGPNHLASQAASPPT